MEVLVSDRKVSSVGVVSMGEAGNLGDDLILISTVDAILRGNPAAAVTFLSHGVPVGWAEVARELGWAGPPVARRRRQELPGRATDSRLFAESDLVVFGGGGLLQNSHSRHEPYQWLSALPTGPARPPIVALGLGLGPFDSQWTSVLSSREAPFDLTYVRDVESQELAVDGLGWSQTQIASDFVSSDFLDLIGVRPAPAGADAVVGVSVRAWPGLSAQAVASRVEAVCDVHEATSVHLFVIEDKPWDHVDLEFTRTIAELLPARLSWEISTYRAENPLEYTRAMTSCRAALSMKFHSSIIWAKAGVKISPIVYAPKVASLFGLPYRGLEVVDGFSQPIAVQPEPTSRDVLTDLVRSPDRVRLRTSRPPFNVRERFTFRGQRLSTALRSRLVRR